MLHHMRRLRGWYRRRPSRWCLLHIQLISPCPAVCAFPAAAAATSICKLFVLMSLRWKLSLWWCIQALDSLSSSSSRSPSCSCFCGLRPHCGHLKLTAAMASSCAALVACAQVAATPCAAAVENSHN